MKRKQLKETGMKEPELPNEVKLLQNELKQHQHKSPYPQA